MTTHTRSTAAFLTHSRIVLGGTIAAFALAATIGIVAGLFQWEFTEPVSTILGFLAVAVIAFVISKWLNGNFIDGLSIGFLFAWLSLILFRQTVVSQIAGRTLLGAFILFVVMPLPLGVTGLISGLIGQFLRKRRSTRTSYTLRCPECGYHNAPSLKNCGRCGQALP